MNGNNISDFGKSKKKFDENHKGDKILPQSLVPVDTGYKQDIRIRNDAGEKLEEYYKWQFIFSVLDSGLFKKDYIGTEVRFPKGSPNAAPLKIDACIFDNKDWRTKYYEWRDNNKEKSLEWLREHLIATIEFKNEMGMDTQKIFTSQVKPEIKESDAEFCLGIYYNRENLYLFQKKNNSIVRYDESKNERGLESGPSHLSLELPDSYSLIPSFDQLNNQVNAPDEIDRSSRTIEDLNRITGVHSSQINNALSNILQKMDKVGLVDNRGYEILIQLLALKIYDERQSTRGSDKLSYESGDEQLLTLSYFVQEEERNYSKLGGEEIQEFISRIKEIYTDAKVEYPTILNSTITIDWNNQGHVEAVLCIVENLQDYSFIRSRENDLYQLVFYKFANEFTKVEKAQFLTPLPLIEFLVKVVNPRGNDSIVDPTAGIADFLSMSYVNSGGKLDDKKIYGADNDDQMIMLAQLNMLLNGDGNAVLRSKSDLGSLRYKFNRNKELVPLEHNLHENGNWDNWKNQTELMKFDVVLTNPPFGDNRKFEPETQRERETAEMYELWNKARSGDAIDLGVLFLENAYRILDENGRMGIVLSNSIASIDRWEAAREWLIERMRIVALFDLPEDTFADTGVNTTLVVGYKPPEEELSRLKEDNYEIFVKNIENIGYEIRTKNRVKEYHDIYKIDDETFETEIDEDGEPVLDEEFTDTYNEFRDWARTQEEKLIELFIE